MNFLKSVRRNVAYAGRHYTPTWRYVFNFGSTMAWRRERPSIEGEAKRVVEELDQNGVAMTTAARLLGEASCFDELGRAIEELESEWAERIAAERAAANRHDASRKTFIHQLLGDHPRLDPGSVYARFALQAPVLRIANEYFGMYTRLRFYNVWHTLTTEGEARESQLWHFDREDHLILKVFVYFSDIDEGAGPFTYAPGTHRKGAIRRQPESFIENGVVRVRDEEMARVVPRGDWVRALGPKGTILFTDTRGYHKGGLARTRDRILYTCLFTSPTSQAPELFERGSRIELPANRAEAMALAGRDH
ncbi:MAG: phytanoyl-CoA dioxygenase family protein [Blastocatellia bacterium]